MTINNTAAPTISTSITTTNNIRKRISTILMYPVVLTLNSISLRRRRKCGTCAVRNHTTFSWQRLPLMNAVHIICYMSIKLCSHRLGLFPSPLLEWNSHQGGRLRHQLRHSREAVEPSGWCPLSLREGLHFVDRCTINFGRTSSSNADRDCNKRLVVTIDHVILSFHFHYSMFLFSLLGVISLGRF